MPLSDLYKTPSSTSLYTTNRNQGISSMFSNIDNQNDDLKRAIRQTENTKRRLEAAGQLDKVRQPERFSITNLLKGLAAPGYAANNLIREFTDPKAGATPNKFDPLSAFWRGLTLKEEVEGSEIVKDFGIKNDILAGVLGFVWDVVNPLDVLNWVSFGVGKSAVKGGLKGRAALSKAFGDDVADIVVKALGNKAGDIAADSVGNLTKKILTLAKNNGVDNVDDLAKIMTEGMLKKHNKLTTKIPYDEVKKLTVGFETPIGGKVLSSKVEIPGSQVITKPLGKAKDAFTSTRVGDRLSRMFSTKYKPKNLQDSVVLKRIQESGDVLINKVKDATNIAKDTGKVLEEVPEIIDNSIEIGPKINKAIKESIDKASGWVEEPAQKAYEEYRKGLSEIFEKTPRKEEDFFRQVEELFKGTTREDRQVVLDALVGKISENQVPENLLPVVDGFKSWRESIVKNYKKMGIPIHELENYVPFIPVRALKESEKAGLQSLFNTAKNVDINNMDMTELLSMIDPNLRQRTTKAIDPREVNKLLDKPWLSEDPAQMMMIRGARAIKAEEAVGFIKNIINTYGIRASELASKFKKPLKGYSLYEEVIDNTGTVSLKQVTKLNEDKIDNIVALPEEFANIFNEYMEIFYNKDSRNAVIRLFDKATNVWKKFAYLYNPGHIPRDMFGNMWQGYLMGMRNPKYYEYSANALKQVPKIMDNIQDYIKEVDSSDIDNIIKAYKKAVKNKAISPITTNINGKNIDLFEAFNKARKYGALETAAAMAETPKSIKQALNIAEGKKASIAIGKYEDLMRKLTENTNNWTRFAGYLHQLGQGKSWIDAAANVKKFYFDYFDLTPFERKVMKRIIPFYTWTRKNIPMELTAMLQRPKDFARVQKAIDAIEGESAEDQELPEWAQDVGLIALGDTGKYINPNLPYQDLGRLPVNRDNIANLLASLNPLIRGPVEWATNTELYSGKPIESYAGEQQDMPFIGSLLRLLGVENVPQVEKRNLGYVLNQLPMLRNLDAIMNPDNPRQGARIATMIGLPSYFDAEQLRASQIYDENARLLELLRLLRDQGIDIPTTDELEDDNHILKLLGIDLNRLDPQRIRERLTNI